MPAFGTATNYAKFRPFSFAEYMAPYEKYYEAYKEQESALETLNAKAMQWEKLANNAADKEQYEQYKSYAESLKAQANDLAYNGLSMGSRRALMDLKTRYASEIVPIEEAWNARTEAAKAWKEVYTKAGGRAISSRNPGEIGLGEYMGGKSPNVVNVNLDNLAAQTATGVAAISKRYHGTKEKGAFGKQYKDLITTEGIAPDQIAEFLSDPNNEELREKYKDIANLIDSMKAGYHYDEFTNAADRAAFDAALNQGINTGATYEEKHDLQRNLEYVDAASRISNNLAKQQLALTASTYGKKWDAKAKKWVNDEENPPLRGNANKNASNPANKVILADGREATLNPDKKGYTVKNSDGTTSQISVKDIYSKPEYSGAEYEEVEGNDASFSFASYGDEPVDDWDFTDSESITKDSQYWDDPTTMPDRKFELVSPVELSATIADGIQRKLNIAGEDINDYNIYRESRGIFSDDYYVVKKKATRRSISSSNNITEPSTTNTEKKDSITIKR